MVGPHLQVSCSQRGRPLGTDPQDLDMTQFASASMHIAHVFLFDAGKC